MKNQPQSFDREPDAEFVGWQVTQTGEAFALYTITDETHPSCGSTVTEQTLRDLNAQPPSVQEYKRPK